MATDVRVNEDDLEWDEDMRLLAGTPFSGVGFALYDDGSLRSESPYRDGFEEGTCREWHPNGRLRREWNAVRGCATELTEWHENGVVKCAGRYEYGAEIEYREWDDAGALLVHRQIDETTELFAYVQSMRQRGGTR
jgi:MORN repeat protein